jgi:hypothetical protein
LVQARFTSRHCSDENYNATVQIDETGISDELMKDCFCICTTGRSVLGCCAHITAHIWHIGVCRESIDYDEHELSTNRFLLSIQDCLQYPDTEDSVNVTDDSGDTDSDNN